MYIKNRIFSFKITILMVTSACIYLALANFTVFAEKKNIITKWDTIHRASDNAD